MVEEEEEEEQEEAHRLVDKAIADLGLKPPITDEQLNEELDQLISETPKDTPMGKLMGEARRRFIYRKDLDVVAAALKKKITRGTVGEGIGTSSLFF